MAYSYQTEIITLERLSKGQLAIIKDFIEELLRSTPGEYNRSVLHSVKINPEPEDD